MSASFDQNIVSGRKVIDFHTHPYRKRGEFMGMYGEHFYLEPELSHRFGSQGRL